jgi:hypothetical protein
MSKKDKPLNYKDPATPMTLLEAEKYLRSVKEWDSVVQMDREIIIKWAEFLKKREETKNNT